MVDLEPSKNTVLGYYECILTDYLLHAEIYTHYLYADVYFTELLS